MKTRRRRPTWCVPAVEAADSHILTFFRAAPFLPPPQGPLTGTCIGRQTWTPVPGTDGVSPAVAPFVAAVNQNGGDRVFRVQALAAAQSPLQDGAPLRTSPVNPQTALDDAIKYYSQLQTDDGHWAGDYGGPMFLLPGLVITCHVTGVDLGPHRKSAMATYLLNHQQEDGGWGLHIESPSTMFGTVLSYVTLRLLGMPAEHPSATAGRQWIQTNGGATLIPSWGKFWLAALGVYEWSGLNPLTPELWALPYWFPLFPGRMWCHCRMVYLPMSYVYGVRASPPSSPLLTALKQELYVTKYAAIDWNKARFEVGVGEVWGAYVFSVAHARHGSYLCVWVLACAEEGRRKAHSCCPLLACPAGVHPRPLLAPHLDRRPRL